MELSDEDTKLLLQYIKDVKNGVEVSNGAKAGNILCSLLTNYVEGRNTKIETSQTSLNFSESAVRQLENKVKELNQRLQEV
ncbi:MAG: hypothetical protein AABY22_01880, partial [Nanoarchaeota archaeon]